MTRYVFVGPTLAVAEARAICDAVYLPPVAQGDIAAVLRHKPSAIAIIDGYYENVPSVWHKEILLALQQGVAVFGAASLGALRATECAAFGMRGVGEIYGWYRDGIIDADDEVAVRHVLSDRGYRATNVALVNVRATLKALLRDALIDQTSHDILLDAARKLHYTQRTLGEIATLAAQQIGERKTWLALLREHMVDQKQLDARALLHLMAAEPQIESPPAPNFRMHHTTKLIDLIDRDAALTWVDGVRVTPQMLVDLMRVCLPDFADFSARALLQAFALNQAWQHELEVADWRSQRLPELLAAEIGDVQAWREAHHMTPRECDAFWLEQLYISEAFSQLDLDLAQAIQWKPKANAPELLRQARLEGVYVDAVAHCLAVEAFWQQHAQPEQVPIETLHEFFCQRQPKFRGQTREQVATALGFVDQTAYLYQLGRLYTFESAQHASLV